MVLGKTLQTQIRETILREAQLEAVVAAEDQAAGEAPLLAAMIPQIRRILTLFLTLLKMGRKSARGGNVSVVEVSPSHRLRDKKPRASTYRNCLHQLSSKAGRTPFVMKSPPRPGGITRHLRGSWK